MKYFRSASRTSPERLSVARRRIKTILWIDKEINHLATIQKRIAWKLVKFLIRDPKEITYEICQNGCGHSYEWFGWSDDLEDKVCHKIVGHNEYGEILCHHKCVYWSIK